MHGFDDRFARRPDDGTRPVRARCPHRRATGAAITVASAGLITRLMPRLISGLVASAGCLSLAAPAEVPGLPPMARTKQTSFSIPFRLPQPSATDKDAVVERVVLQVSRDLGGTWQDAGEASPASGSIAYRAAADGEYWFRLRAIDRQGRTRGGPGPDMRVLVDAAAPRLAARVWKGADGEIICRYAAADDSIDLAGMRFEYRAPGDPGWKTVAAEGILARQAPAHMVGEEIWWAGEKVDALTVRITVSDAAGNQTARQFSLEPNDPHVDQASLAAEIGVPPLPGDPEPRVTAPFTVDPAVGRTSAAETGPARTTTAMDGWPGERAAPWANGQPSLEDDGEPTERGSDRVTSRGQIGAPRSVLVGRGSQVQQSTTTPASSDIPESTPTIAAGRPARGTVGEQPLEYRGRPLLLSRSRRFAWDYEATAGPTAGQPLQAVLWSTADGGATWTRAATADAGRGALDVLLPGSGLYGFRLELAASPDGPGPGGGDAPETWVGVDEEPPQVEIVAVTAAEEVEDAILIRYSADDALLAPRGGRLLYSPHASGPWATITSHAESRGDYTWRPDAAVPGRVYIRVEVADAAGNVGSATTAEPVTVAPSRFTGRLGGLKPLPTSAP
jgi:hypothetical protein